MLRNLRIGSKSAINGRSYRTLPRSIFVRSQNPFFVCSLSMAESKVVENFWSDLPQEELFEGSYIGTVYQYKGFWFALPFLQSTKEVLGQFKPLPTDVILTSYPKTGTTWLKAILYSILNRPSLSSTPDSSSSSSALRSNHPHELVPALEIQLYRPDFFSKSNSSAATAEVMSFLGSSQTLQTPESLDTDTDTNTGKRRIFNTHIPFQLFADHSIDSSDCKIVYVTRNPKDTLISMWHFVKKFQLEGAKSWPLEAAVDKFCSGVAPYGPYYDHVLRYKKESYDRPDKFFFTTYEELTDDGKGVVKRLAEFLGCPFGKDEEDQMEEIVKNCSIDTLKTHGVNKSDECTSWFPLPYNAFFRKGHVGDHKNYLTPEMIERIDAITREKFHGSGFMFGI